MSFQVLNQSKKKTTDLTVERLKEVVSYEPLTGEFFWKEKIAKWVKIGEKVKCKPNKNGWRGFDFDGIGYHAHRLAWLYVYGVHPPRLKWKNGNRADLRISNLITDAEWRKLQPKIKVVRQKKHRDVFQRGKDKKENRIRLDMTEYERMFKEQKGCCAICDKPETQLRKGKPIAISVDHCHDSGEIRGLLCCACNKMIGLANDDASILRKAIGYLNKAKTKVSEVDNVVFLQKKENV